MSLRFRLHLPKSLGSGRYIAVRSEAPVRQLVPLTLRHLQTATHSSQDAGSARPEERHNGSRHQSPPRGSIRPLTVLALCTPLGYAVRWAMKEYEASKNSASADGFIKYTITKKETVSSTCAIFTLTPRDANAIDTTGLWADRAVKSVLFKQPQLQIARSYTLLPPTSAQGELALRFLIRKEYNGEVSGYLHRLPIGAEVEVQGFRTDFVIPEEVDKVIFLAGGTGVAPALQVASILDGEAEMRLLWANRRREECVGGRSDLAMPVDNSWRTLFGILPRTSREAAMDREVPSASCALVQELERVKAHSAVTVGSQGQRPLTVDYYVDEEGTFIRHEEIVHALRAAQSMPGNRLILVSGPEGFINYWAGPTQWIDGKETQGPLGGILGRLQKDELKGWQVVKL